MTKTQKTIQKIKDKIIIILGGYTDLKVIEIPQFRYYNCIPKCVKSSTMYNVRDVLNSNYKEYIKKYLSHQIADYLYDNNLIQFEERDSIELLKKEMVASIYVTDIFPA